LKFLIASLLESQVHTIKPEIKADMDHSIIEISDDEESLDSGENKTVKLRNSKSKLLI
jgi:hypothetical protein